jgi:hypothetical protein
MEKFREQEHQYVMASHRLQQAQRQYNHLRQSADETSDPKMVCRWRCDAGSYVTRAILLLLCM